MKETLGKEFYESADKAITISRPETVEQAAERLIPIITRSTPFGSKFEWEPRKERKAFIKGVKWQKEQDSTANEILDYILTNDDGVGIALGYNSREMIEQYFKRINYGKSK